MNSHPDMGVIEKQATALTAAQEQEGQSLEHPYQLRLTFMDRAKERHAQIPSRTLSEQLRLILRDMVCHQTFSALSLPSKTQRIMLQCPSSTVWGFPCSNACWCPSLQPCTTAVEVLSLFRKNLSQIHTHDTTSHLLQSSSWMRTKYKFLTVSTEI